MNTNVLSEDIVNYDLEGKEYLLWNLFKPLEALGNKSWIQDLFKFAYKASFLTRLNIEDMNRLEVYYRHGQKEKFFPPPDEYNQSLHTRLAEVIEGNFDINNFPGEEPTAVDIVIKSDKKIILIEALLENDIEYATPVDPVRDQISRILDVGSADAKKEKLEFFFILLTPELPYGTRLYHYRMHEFLHHPLGIKEKLPHRKDLSWHELSEHIGWLTWDRLIKIWEKYVPGEGVISEENVVRIKETAELIVQKVQT